MKISQNELETKKVSSVNHSAQPQFKKGEADPSIIEPTDIYCREALDYAAGYGYSLAASMKAALQRRNVGQKVVTARESDIAARNKLDLSGEMIKFAFFEMNCLLLEGTIGVKRSAWDLRREYNRGIAFKKTHYERSGTEKKEKADEAMRKILIELQELSLPAWPHEISEGFPVELTKPEFMTFEQYNAAKNKTVIQDAGQKNLF